MDPKLTPMMKQYLELKKKYSGEILFFRLGDFYEMFFDDAHTASKILDIALTSRQNDVPMCGIPYHAAESYIARLIKAGHRVAICEQMEATPSAGGIVRREVTRVITPGTLVEQNLLSSDSHNFLCSAVLAEKEMGLSFIDISTGDFFLSSMEKSLELFKGEMARYSPREIIMRESGDPDDERFSRHVRAMGVPSGRLNDWLYDEEYLQSTIRESFRLAGTKGLGIPPGVEMLAAGSILEYLKDTQKKILEHLKLPRRINASDSMQLDEASIAHLELVANQQDGTRNRTLYSVLNRTCTAMGKRALERAILQPLLSREEIERRLDLVQYFHEFHELAQRVRELLEGVYDIERLVARFIMGRSIPRDLIAVRNSLQAAGAVKSLLAEQAQELCIGLAGGMPDLSELAGRIDAMIEENPASSPEQGRVIRKGYSAELDRLYDLKKDARAWILSYQEEEKKRLGIPTLKVKYNRVLGYYIEVSKGQTSKVPNEYFRKQTLVGAERYTTETLQKFEQDILHASDRIVALENEELGRLHAEILSRRGELQTLGSELGVLDLHCALAVAATEGRFVRPRFNERGETLVRDGRHPIVERYYTAEAFVPNDVRLDGEEHLIQIITGPNMSGKSTYIRMAAVIQLMAQIGSFVPAAEADLPIVDRIFTRIGASDNISRGESTFLVEMNETALILNNATTKSLIVMDEVGRGTSTYDGLSIAWAVVEYILRYIRARTLFATHYHELTQLGSKKGIVNYNVLVREDLGGVSFLHRVAPGAADKSYGIHVARLAGIPKEITARAAKILERLERSGRSAPVRSADEGGASAEQLDIFNAANHRVIQAIRSIKVDELTPIQAINELNRLKDLVK